MRRSLFAMAWEIWEDLKEIEELSYECDDRYDDLWIDEAEEQAAFRAMWDQKDQNSAVSA